MMINAQNPITNASVGSSIEVLQNIQDKGKNIAIYQREAGFFQQQLQALTDKTFECRANGNTDKIRAKLATYFADHFPEHSFLFDDIIELLHQFQAITKVNSFRLLLATISSNMCSKFHTDINTLRMLCTYVGPGTIWVPDNIINPSAFYDKNQPFVHDEKLLQQSAAGDVLIMKGALYPDTKPVFHRSPSIAETGERRLLLRIDTNESTSLWN